MTIPPVRLAAYVFSAAVHASIVGAALLVSGDAPPRMTDVAGFEVEVVVELPGGLLENAAEDAFDSAPSEVRETSPDRETEAKAEARPPLRAAPSAAPAPSVEAPLSEPPAEGEQGVETASLPAEFVQPASVAAAAKPAEKGPSLAPRPLANPRPIYPREARRRGVEGHVLLRVVVGEKGMSEAVTLLETSGYSVLDEAAIAAIRKWRFEPARRGGTPMTAAIDVPVTFRINREEE